MPTKEEFIAWVQSEIERCKEERSKFILSDDEYGISQKRYWDGCIDVLQGQIWMIERGKLI